MRRGQGGDDPVTRRLLEKLVLLDDRPRWNDWARRQLARSGATQPADAAVPRGVPYTDPDHYP